jgi:glutathione S-transferase
MLRIFSYLPNPRVWKSLIAAEYCGVEIEVVGAKPAELGRWLWDFDARPMEEHERNPHSPHARLSRRGFSGTIYKTEAFLHAHPFGTVPAAFADQGQVGIFESNSILRAVAREGREVAPLYGRTDAQASRIDSFLDADLVFSREAQVYLLGMDDPKAAVVERMAAAYEFYLAGIEATLSQTPFLCGSEITIADISFVCDFAQFLREGHYKEALREAGFSLVSEHGMTEYPRAFQLMLDLSQTPEFAKHMGNYLNWFRREIGVADG